jgi:hypothetical protein
MNNPKELAERRALFFLKYHTIFSIDTGGARGNFMVAPGRFSLKNRGFSGIIIL